MQTLSPVTKFALAVVLSLLACTSYYTVERLDGDATSITLFVASLATPVALLSLVGTIGLLRQRSKWRPLLWLSVPALAASSAFLIRVWV
jgi:hypothetical protein